MMPTDPPRPLWLQIADTKPHVELEPLPIDALLWPRGERCSPAFQGGIESVPMRPGVERKTHRRAHARLTATDVLTIRALAKAGYLQRGIAERFGVKRHHISDIVTGKSWANLGLQKGSFTW